MISDTTTLAHPIAVRMAALAEPETRHLIETGQRHGWDFDVLGIAPVPDGPVKVGNWLLSPARLDTSPIPDRAMERLQTLFAAGVRPVEIILAHEAPMLLTAPANDIQQSEKVGANISLPRWRVMQNRLSPKTTAGTVGMIALGALALPAVAAVALVAVAGIALLLSPMMLVGGALTLDPILIIVTPAGFWVEIDRWDNEVS